MLTFLCIFFYAYFFIYINDFTVFNYIVTIYIYIFSFAYIVNYVFFNYIVIISTLTFMLLTVSLPITYLLHLFFCLYCQLYLLQLYIHRIYSFAFPISYILSNYIIITSIFSLTLSTFCYIHITAWLIPYIIIMKSQKEPNIKWSKMNI